MDPPQVWSGNRTSDIWKPTCWISPACPDHGAELCRCFQPRWQHSVKLQLVVETEFPLSWDISRFEAPDMSDFYISRSFGSPSHLQESQSLTNKCIVWFRASILPLKEKKWKEWKRAFHAGLVKLKSRCDSCSAFYRKATVTSLIVDWLTKDETELRSRCIHLAEQ